MEAAAVAVLSYVTGSLFSLAKKNFFQSVNLDKDLNKLGMWMNHIQPLLSDAQAILSDALATQKLISVETWFDTLKTEVDNVKDFISELNSEVDRVNLGNPSNRKKVVDKIAQFQASIEDIFKIANNLGIVPVQLLISMQSRDIRSTPPIDDESEIVGRDNYVPYLDQTVSGNHRENLRVVVSRDVSNIEEARRARLCEKSNIRHLVLIWKNNQYEMGDGEYNDEDVMEGLKPHPNLKELTVEGFMGKKFASWIARMPYLVKITLKDCNMCELLQPLPRIGSLEIKNCPRLRMTPNSCFPSLKDFRIGKSNMFLENMSRNVSSLTYLELKYISDGGGDLSSSSSSSRSNRESIINLILENNSRFLDTLDLVECKGVKRLKVGVSLKNLWVCDCPDLMSIHLDQGSAGLISLSIRECSSSLLDMVSTQVQSYTLERLRLGPFLENLDEFPWPFSSSAFSLKFPKLYSLELFGWEMLKSGRLFEQLQFSTFPALKKLIMNDIKGVETLPDSIANFQSLEKLEIKRCENLKNLPTFAELHSLQKLCIDGCSPFLKERYNKKSGSEWFKIQHIRDITWDKEKWQGTV